MSHTDRSAVLADGVIDDDELDALSKNDLREMIEELNKEVLQRDQDIQDLTQQLESGKKRRGKGDLDRDLATLESQIAALSDKYQRSESEREHAQEELANTRAQLNNLSEEKKQLELRLKYIYSMINILSFLRINCFLQISGEQVYTTFVG